ncbi:Transcriptional activator MetR [Labilithrix luteola]|uniref:Transcriptional activator MetR n=1 Tax=Labilithrix luteola TaxID=1391654 RepID=A0A0K1PLV1_9BACT|nr:LysR family transcriptional regulator [Labilithrix luteola]AKU94089.1 Transcriptional activator MetR [Labilithrix luteola]
MTAPVLDTRHLRLLVALEGEGSLHAAARKLHLTPSALSLQLRELEDRLGGKLFERRWRRLHPTAAAAHLTETSRSMLTEMSRAEDEARRLMNGSTGTLRITMACAHSYRWLPALLKNWAVTWPSVEITIVPEAASDPLAWLRARKLDLALVSGETSKDPRIDVRPLFEDELVAVVGRGHSWFARQWVAPESFATEHYWGPRDAFASGTPLGELLGRARVTPRKVTDIAFSSGVPVEMASANLGITVCPRWFVEDAIARRQLAPIRIGKEGLWLSWELAVRAESSTQQLNALVKAMMAHHPKPRRRRSRRPAVGEL